MTSRVTRGVLSERSEVHGIRDRAGGTSGFECCAKFDAFLSELVSVCVGEVIGRAGESSRRRTAKLGRRSWMASSRECCLLLSGRENLLYLLGAGDRFLQVLRAQLGKRGRIDVPLGRRRLCLRLAERVGQKSHFDDWWQVTL